jgi:hypothetical protein
MPVLKKGNSFNGLTRSMSTPLTPTPGSPVPASDSGSSNHLFFSLTDVALSALTREALEGKGGKEGKEGKGKGGKENTKEEKGKEEKELKGSKEGKEERVGKKKEEGERDRLNSLRDTLSTALAKVCIRVTSFRAKSVYLIYLVINLLSVFKKNRSMVASIVLY